MEDPEPSPVDALTEGRGADVVVDTVGQPLLTKTAISKLARGRLAFIAAPRTGITDLAFDMTDSYRKGKTVISCNTLLYYVEEFAQLMKAMTPSFEKADLKPGRESEWTHVDSGNGVDAYGKAKQRGAGKFIIR